MNGMVKTGAAASEGELFKKVLGAQWLLLHPDIRHRFDKNPSPGEPLRYVGSLSELTSSWVGKLLGYVTYPFIKGALIPFDDADFPVDIEVYAKPGCGDIFKQRIYRLHGRPPIQFTSYMRESVGGEVLEYVGKGLGMKLRLRVVDGNLHFRSDGYFWEVLGWRMPLPGWLTPGQTDLSHCNDSPTQFNIRIEIRHALFGITFKQVGVFRDADDVPGDAAADMATALPESPARLPAA